MYPWQKDKFTPEDYLDFSTRFGRSVNDGPEIFPAFNFYYQDISLGGSEIGNETLLNGERMFPPGQDPVYPDFEWKWYVDGVLMSTKAEPRFSDFIDQLTCDGVISLQVEVYHKPSGVGAIREEWVYWGYNDVPSCNHPNAPGQFDVYIPFYPDVDPREEYGFMAWDLTGDRKVSSADLIKFLSMVEPEQRALMVNKGVVSMNQSNEAVKLLKSK